MNEITILIWIAIAIIAIISIILVKSHYNNENEKENEEYDSSIKKIEEELSINKNKSKNKKQTSLSPETPKTHIKFRKETKIPPKNDAYIVPEVEENNLKNYEYENQNKVLINYNNKIKKFQEPIKENQMDIMTQNFNKKKDETELKDLFTIDELIKESKRKDSQREKESQQIKKDRGDDKELDDIKESIKNKTEEPLIEEIVSEQEKSKNIKTEEFDETPTLTQKDIDDAIKAASEEIRLEDEKVKSSKNITNILLTEEEKQKTESKKISEPALKTPSKINTNNDIGVPIDDSNLFDDEETMDLDYRKDLDKFTNKIKGSKIYQEVREKLTSETEEYLPEDEMYIRNVNEYDDYEPIVNETHIDYEAKYGYPNLSDEERLRQENTRKVFNMAKNTQEPTVSTIKPFKSKPSRNNIKLNLNNNEVVLKKGDEIIFNYMGDTYSSQVYAIKGDDISVKYRRKFITIKPKDVKKIY